MTEAYGIGEASVKDGHPPERIIKTAAHVCQIFDSFSSSRTSLSLTEIATSLGLRKSSVHRLLRTLVAHRYLANDSADRRYRLGQRLGNCARVYAMSSSVASLVRPYLENLRLRTQETVTLQARTGTERQVVIQLEGTHTIRAVIDDRRSYPLDAGAAGHVFRAFSSDWREYPDGKKLSEIRESGFAASRGELMEGAMAIYCPVPDSNAGSVQFVVGIQGPEFRLSTKVADMVGHLKAVALELTDVIPPDAPIR